MCVRFNQKRGDCESDDGSKKERGQRQGPYGGKARREKNYTRVGRSGREGGGRGSDAPWGRSSASMTRTQVMRVMSASIKALTFSCGRGREGGRERRQRGVSSMSFDHPFSRFPPPLPPFSI